MEELTGNHSFTSDDIQYKFGYHKGNEDTMEAHGDTRRTFMAFASFLDETLPPGRAKAVAFTELETASMWAHKAIAELAPVVPE